MFSKVKKKQKIFTGEYIHECPNQSSKTFIVNAEMHEKFTIYRNLCGWNERALLVNDLETLNNERKKKNRKICLIIDKAPCHLLGKNPLPNLSNLTLVYIEKKMTDKLQENFINY